MVELLPAWLQPYITSDSMWAVIFSVSAIALAFYLNSKKFLTKQRAYEQCVENKLRKDFREALKLERRMAAIEQTLELVLNTIHGQLGIVIKAQTVFKEKKEQDDGGLRSSLQQDDKK